jgi:hypothetical protein
MNTMSFLLEQRPRCRGVLRSILVTISSRNCTLALNSDLHNRTFVLLFSFDEFLLADEVYKSRHQKEDDR